jgi:allophanate hydrolase
MIPELLDIASIRAGYRDGSLTPIALFTALLDRMDSYPDKAVFISRLCRKEVLGLASALDLAQLDALPLFGIPFAVKDNIDVAGIPTTAACPAFAYTPAADATVVARLRAAGAIPVGKTNLDQFATGLNGTRSPHGAPRSVFNADYISGGSSSGSAVSVAAGLVCFALGTDTAGSGRVPAGINNLIGLKPSIGRLSSTGVVPACKSLDCISIFTNSADDALAVLSAGQGFDAADCYSREPGWKEQPIDYGPFLEIAKSLYGGAFVAERLAAVESFYKSNPDDFDPAVRSIIETATKYSAADLFRDIYQLQARKRLAAAELAKCDVLLLPTVPTTFMVKELQQEPIARNSVLGTYTNFVNLMDLAAIALPGGFGGNRLAYGVTLIGPAFSERSLAAYADQLHKSLGAGAGKSRLQAKTAVAHPVAEEINLVVAGAHLSGMVLNHELTALDAKLIGETKTAPNYKLFALATTPPKPGLVRSADASGSAITVEVWSLTQAAFGRFVAALPAPMGIGKVTLADGTEHPGFLCEAHALDNARDITAYGGWRAYKTAN